MNQADAKGGLSCGKPALDAYFTKRAWDHHQKGVAKVFVLEDLAAPGVILGSYSLSASSWESDRLQGPLPSSLPTYPMPLFSIGYVAVTQARQGQGLGKRLMADALRRCLDAAESTVPWVSAWTRYTRTARASTHSWASSRCRQCLPDRRTIRDSPCSSP